MIYRKLKRLYLSVFLLVCGCSVSQKHEAVVVKEDLKPIKPVYFITVPITKRASTQSPCVDIHIEETTFSVELDLGYRGNLTLSKPYADTIASKVFLWEKSMYGMRGKEYVTKLYQIPELKIGKMTFRKPFLQEEPEEFTQDATFIQKGKERSPRDPGSLGWELFYGVNLLVDTKNSLIAFCDSLETLAKQGYDVEHFTSAPLFLEQGLVEFDCETPEGILRCMLDTGATWNMLNDEIGETQSLDEAMWDDQNLLQYPYLRIGGNDFGSIVFHRVPIHLPIRIEAVLGMEFCEDNLIFLDFCEKQGYFLKR